MGQPDEATAPLERALSLRGDEGGAERARIRFCLARALWESKADKQRAVALGKQAMATYAEAGENTEKERIAVAAWLRRLGVG
jgi:hypothetical protein